MLTIIIGCVIAVGLLIYGIKDQNLGVLREFRTKLKGYSDLLQYAAMVDDGIILNKDGSLLAAWAYRGNDMDSASSYELDALSQRVNQAFKRRGGGWMMHVDALRKPATTYSAGGSFPDRTSALVDLERRLQYEAEGHHFETQYVLCVTYLPPAEREDKITDLLIEGDKVKEDSAQRAMRTFKAALSDIEDTLSYNLRFKRLKGRIEKDARGDDVVFDELLQYLTFAVTGVDHPVRLPQIPMYLDALIGSVDFYGGLKPRVGNRSLRMISITGFPNESFPGILEGLNRLAMVYRWSNRFIFLDPPDAAKLIQGRRKKWFMGRKTMRSYVAEQAGQVSNEVNNDSAWMAQDAQAASDELAGDVVRFGFYTSTVIVAEEDPAVADERAREIMKLLFNLGFNARVEDVNAVESFLGTHPANGYANVRKPLLSTRNLADFLPLTTIWSGEPVSPNPFLAPNSPPLAYGATSGATPFRINLHVGDVGHTLVLGPTGAGKSTLLAFLTSSFFRYPGAQVFVFDKGYSAYPLVKSCGGEHYDILGEQGSPQFCPLLRCDDPLERAWASEWLETLITLQGVTLNPASRRAIFHALTLLGESESRTMTDLLHGPLQEPNLRAALDRYTLDGPLGLLLDSKIDTLREDPFQVFELEHLMETGSNSARNVVPVLLYLFRRIEQRLDGRPTLLILDEAWTFIDNSLFAEKIRDWLKTLRKKNAAVIFATQSVGDVMNKPITTAIVESCLTKIFLPNPEARSMQSAEAYKQIGLSDRQMEILSFAIPKRQYYLSSPNGQRLFDLGLGPVALSFVGAAGKEDLKVVRDLSYLYGDNDWPAEWLWRRNLKVAAARWLGGEAEQDLAYRTMNQYRDTWPGEWMRAHDREDHAIAWFSAYDERLARLRVAQEAASTTLARRGIGVAK